MSELEQQEMQILQEVLRYVRHPPYKCSRTAVETENLSERTCWYKNLGFAALPLSEPLFWKIHQHHFLANPCRRSKEEYEEEMARKEHLAQKLGSTSASIHEEPVRNGTDPQAAAHSTSQPINSLSKVCYT